MAKMLNDKNILKKKKLKYGLLFIGLALLVFLVFMVKNFIEVKYYTFIVFINIIIIFATAYYGVRFFIYLPYRDGTEENLNKLLGLSNKFFVLNGVLINDEKMRGYFERVIISPNKIYFINLDDLNKEKCQKYDRLVKKIMAQREIKLGYKTIYTSKEYDNVLNKLKSQNQLKVTKGQMEAVDKIKFITI